MPDPTVVSTTVTLKFAQGIDNQAREYALADQTARTINNLDVTRDGGLCCRKGLRQVTTGDCHSLFAHPHGQYALLVYNGVLNRLNADESMTALTAVSGAVSYAVLNDEIFWSDGTNTGRVLANGAAGGWGLATPPQPQVAVVAGYGLTAGTYRVAMTAIQMETGLESGAAEPVEVTIPSGGGGIQIIAPAALPAYHFAIYLTPVYGDRVELRRVTTLAPSATAILTTLAPDGMKLQSLLAEKPYPATSLLAFKGRLWAASGSVVWYTSERSPHWLFPDTGYFAFPSTVRMLGATEDGIYVGLADCTYYLQGQHPAQMTQRLVSSHGAVAGGGQDLPADVLNGDGGTPACQCAWWDTDGVWCVGKSGGLIIRPHGDRFAAGQSLFTTGSARETAGLRQWVALLRADDPLTSALQAVDC